LPKAYRKHLVPIARTVDRIVQELPWGQGNLVTALSQFIHDRLDLDIPAAAWPLDQLPAHLKMRLAIIDQHGDIVRASRAKASLYAATRERRTSERFEQLVRQWERSNITAWDFDDLDTTVVLRAPQGSTAHFYPGLAVDDSGIHLRLFSEAHEASASHRQGVAALAEICLAKEIRFLKQSLKLPSALTPAARYFGGLKALEKRLYMRIRDSLFKKNLRTRKDFQAHLQARLSEGFHRHGQTDKHLMVTVVEAYADTRQTLHDLETTSRGNSYTVAYLNDLRAELANLVPDNFLDLYTNAKLEDLPRYLRALLLRAQRGVVNLEKDRQRSAAVAVFTDHLQTFLHSLAPDVSTAKRRAIETLHWMIEEYKISVFAQEVKTNGPISAKRLEEQIKRIERMT
jgi:ATP-dependent helicase HrpA